MRAALYARYSTENQSEASVEDQLRICRQLAANMGAHVVREFTDEKQSGFSGARPGLAGLLALARARGCDLVIAEHSDRLARDGEKSWQVFNLLRSAGVRYFTVQEGEVTVVHQGVSSLVSELKGEEVRHRTRRGLQGVVESGRSGGGLTYGYRVKRLYDARGEPIRGHLEIDPAQAEVVVRIFRDYAAGASPLAIAAALNAQAVPGPRGGQWRHSTIAGNAARGHGIVHNVLYVGERVWGRRTFVKDRATGIRHGRDAPGELLRKPVPDLRIVDDELWAAARARHAQVAASNRGGPGVPRGDARRPKRFLQGLIKCAGCGASLVRAGPRDALRCATRIAKGACDNTRAPGYAGIEARVIAAIRGNLLHPEVIEHAIREVQAGLAAARQDAGKRRARLSAELGETRRRMARLIDQLEDGVPWKAIAGRHAGLEARAAELETQLTTTPADADVVPFGPAIAAKYRAHLERLVAALDHPEDLEGREDRAAVRALISEIRFTPAEGHGQYELEIVGDLAPLLALSTNEKGPLAGAVSLSSSVSGPNSMGRVGAGTRVTHTHTLTAPFRQVA